MSHEAKRVAYTASTHLAPRSPTVPTIMAWSPAQGMATEISVAAMNLSLSESSTLEIGRAHV